MSDSRQPIDRLVESERIKGASRIIADAADPSSVTKEHATAVIEAVRDYQKRTGLRWNEIARSIGARPSSLSLLNNAHLYSIPFWQELTIDLDLWLEQELKREAAPKPAQFVMTAVAQEVLTVASAAATLRCIGLVFGPSGIGKSMALRAVAAEKPGTLFVSMKTAAVGAMDVLQAIAAELGIRDFSRMNKRTLMARVEELLKGTPRLVIVDEVHKLCGAKDDRALHVLRDMYDATNVPMLWCGTIDLVEYLERAEAKAGREPLAQIRRRIGIARDLTQRTRDGSGGPGDPLFSVDEIRRVFARGKMRITPEAARYLTTLANLPDSGALGTVKNLVLMAVKISEVKGDEITVELLRSVHQLLVSRNDFKTMAGRLEVAAAPPHSPMTKVG